MKVVVLAAILALLLAPWVAAQVRPVEDWTSQPLNARGVPAGWKKLPDVLTFAQRAALSIFSEARYDFAVVASGPERALHLKSADEHSIIVKNLAGVDLKATPILDWTWRVDVLPQGGNLSKNDQSDSAAELHLFWKTGDRTIGYAWDETLPVEKEFKNPRRKEVRFLIVTSGKARPGEWIRVTRDVMADHQTIYGVEPSGPPDRIAISIDSNQTRSTAEAYIGAIRFRAR